MRLLLSICLFVYSIAQSLPTDPPLSFSQNDAYIKFSLFVLPTSNITFFILDDLIAPTITSPLRSDLSTIVEVGMSRLVVLSVYDMATNNTQILSTSNQVNNVSRRLLQVRAKQIIVKRERQLQVSNQSGFRLDIAISLGTNPDAVIISKFINRTVTLLLVASKSIPFLPLFLNALVTKTSSKLAPSLFTFLVDFDSLVYIPSTKTASTSDNLFLSVLLGSSFAGGLFLFVCCYFCCRMYFIAKANKESLERELRIVRPSLKTERMRDRKLLSEDKKKKIFIPVSSSTRSLAVHTDNAVVKTNNARRTDAIIAVEVSSARWEDSFIKFSEVFEEKESEELRQELETVRNNILKLESRLKKRNEKKRHQEKGPLERDSKIIDSFTPISENDSSRESGDTKDDDIAADIDLSKLWIYRKEGFDAWFENAEDSSLIEWDLPEGGKVVNEAKVKQLKR